MHVTALELICAVLLGLLLASKPECLGYEPKNKEYSTGERLFFLILGLGFGKALGELLPGIFHDLMNTQFTLY